MKDTYFKIEDPWGPVYSLNFRLKDKESLKQAAKKGWCDIKDITNDYEYFVRDGLKVKVKVKIKDDDTVLIEFSCIHETKMLHHVK